MVEVWWFTIPGILDYMKYYEGNFKGQLDVTVYAWKESVFSRFLGTHKYLLGLIQGFPIGGPRWSGPIVP